MPNFRGRNQVSFAPRSGRARRSTQWLEVELVASSQASIGGVILNSLTTAEKALRPFTIVRTHLSVLLSSDQVAADEFQVAGLGVAVVSDQAAAIGITAVPTPLTDLESDLWLFHQIVSTFSTASANGGSGALWSKEFESKAMRKVEEGQDVIVVSEFSALGDGWTMITGGRVLIKLH